MRRHFWISPGALLGVLASYCAIALLVVFVAVPFYRSQGQTAANQRAGVVLLQRFDCTYGSGLNLGLGEVERIQQDAAHRALLTIKQAQQQHNPDLESAARRARADALESVGRLEQIRMQLKPLAPADNASTC